MTVEDYCSEFEEVGNFQFLQDGQVVEIRCVRLWAMNPTQVLADVSITSNAQWEWRTQIVQPDGTKLDLPQGSPWCKIIEEVCCFTRSQQSPMEVRRFAIASHANHRFRNGGELDTMIRFTQKQDGCPAAIGLPNWLMLWSFASAFRLVSKLAPVMRIGRRFGHFRRRISGIGS